MCSTLAMPASRILAFAVVSPSPPRRIPGYRGTAQGRRSTGRNGPPGRALAALVDRGPNRARRHAAGLDSAGEPGRGGGSEEQEREDAEDQERQGDRAGAARRPASEEAAVGAPGRAARGRRAAARVVATRGGRATRGGAAARACARAVPAVLADRGEERPLDVVGRARVVLHVRVGVQMLDRLRVAGNRVDAVDAVVVEPVVDDLEPAVARRSRCGGRRGGGARGGG